MREHVLVLMGGPSFEHDVSVVSGTGVVRALDANKYKVHPVFISRDNEWIWSSQELSPYQKENFSPNYFATVEGTAMRREKAPALSQLPSCRIAVLALHGSFGEDGRVQALLEHWGIAYTGSGVAGSAIAMNKILSKRMYNALGIATPPSAELRRAEFNGTVLADLGEHFGYPLVLKNPTGGSSLGLGIAADLEEAGTLAQKLFAGTDVLLVERFIAGREASCGYIEGLPPLPPTEICMTTRTYFDFEAKYKGESREVTPAQFPLEWTNHIQDLARICHHALGCQVYSRSDFRIDDHGQIWALETNTLPGMTPQSILPQQAAALGLSFTQLLNEIIEGSLRKKN